MTLGRECAGDLRALWRKRLAAPASRFALRRRGSVATTQGAELLDVIDASGDSAKSMKRRGLRRVLALVEADDVQALIVAKVDRLTRSVQFLCPGSTPIGCRIVGSSVRCRADW